MAPATPGTLIVLAATVCLVMVSVSTPIVKSIYFLSADIGVSIASVSINGQVKLGVFGYCVDGIGTSSACQGPQVGYELSSDAIFGNTSSISIPDSLIKWLTYALIIHPIAAGMAALSFVLGVISHFREFSRARLSTWVASLASTLAMLAFIFDMVAFSIAKSRLNSADTGDVSLAAELGNGIWLTLAGFVLLFISSCAFGCGHRMLSRRPRQDEKDAVRPRVDPFYASEARRDAQDLEKQERARRANNGSGLPAFPEEEMPLTAIPPNSNGQYKEADNYSDESIGSQDIGGVGIGYGRGPGARQNTGNGSTAASAMGNAAGVGAGGRPSERRQNSASAQNTAEPFVSMYNQQQTSDPYGQYQPRRQGSNSTATAHNQPPSGYLYDPPQQQQQQQQQQRQQMGYVDSPGPMNFPTPGQHGGREAYSQQYQYPTRQPSQYSSHVNPAYISMPVAPVPTYPPASVAPNSAPPQQASIPYHRTTDSPSNLPYTNASHRPHDSTPWLPPMDTGGSISIPQGQSSFYAAATNSNSTANNYQPQGPRHRRIPSDTTHYQSQPNSSRHHFQQASASQPQQNHDREDRLSPSGARFQSHPAVTGTSNGVSPANATVASPPYDIYEYYGTDAPQRRNSASPSAIPYHAHEPSHTPTPTYQSNQAYPSYGGNAYR